MFPPVLIFPKRGKKRWPVFFFLVEERVNTGANIATVSNCKCDVPSFHDNKKDCRRNSEYPIASGVQKKNAPRAVSLCLTRRRLRHSTPATRLLCSRRWGGAGGLVHCFLCFIYTVDLKLNGFRGKSDGRERIDDLLAGDLFPLASHSAT